MIISLLTATDFGNLARAQDDHGSSAGTYNGHISAPRGDIDFNDYVRDALGWSIEIAQHAAYDKELYEFGTSLQMARDSLRDSIGAGREVLEFLNADVARIREGCPLNENRNIDVERLLDDIFRTSVAQARWHEALEHEKRYEELMKRLSRRCNDSKAFDSYKADDLYLSYLPAPVYREYHRGWFSSLVDPAGIFLHTSESRSTFEARYKDSKEKLRTGTIDDAKYQAMAQSACRKIQEARKGLPARLDSIHAAVKGFFEQPVEKSLARRSAALAACRKKYENELFEFFRKRAHEEAVAAHKGEADTALRLRLNIDSSQRLRLAVARLRRISCREGSAIAHSIRTDIALSDLFDLGNRKTVVPDAVRALAAFRERCGEAESQWSDSRAQVNNRALQEEHGFARNALAQRLMVAMILLQERGPSNGNLTYDFTRRGEWGLYFGAPPVMGNVTGVGGGGGGGGDGLPGHGGGGGAFGGSGFRGPGVGGPSGRPGGAGSSDIGDSDGRSGAGPGGKASGGRGSRGRTEKMPEKGGDTTHQSLDGPTVVGGGQGNGAGNGGTPVIGNAPRRVGPSPQSTITYGNGSGRGDEVPYARHVYYLRTRAAEAGPASAWTKGFEDQLEHFLPGTGVSDDLDAQTKAAIGVARDFEDALGGGDLGHDEAVKSPAAGSIPAIDKVKGRVGSVSSPPADRWKAFDILDQVHAYGLGLVPGSVAMAVEEGFAAELNKYGLLDKNALGAKHAPLSRALGKELRTSKDAPIGHEIRRQINRGLIILSSDVATDAEKAEARGAIGLLLGADAAASNGKNYYSNLLGREGSALLDGCMGKGSAASTKDGEQLVHGMATGLDYSGRPMDAAEYAFAGLGKGLGVFGNGRGGGGAGLGGMTIAGKPVGKFFQAGRNYVKGNALRLPYFNALQSTKQKRAAGQITSALGFATKNGAKVTPKNIQAFVGLLAGSTVMGTIIESTVGLGTLLSGGGLVAGGVVGTVIALDQLRQWWLAMHETEAGTVGDGKKGESGTRQVRGDTTFKPGDYPYGDPSDSLSEGEKISLPTPEVEKEIPQNVRGLIRKAKNICDNNAQPKDFAGVREKKMTGKEAQKPGTDREWNHTREMQQSVRSVKDIADRVSKNLSNQKLSPRVREYLSDFLERAQRLTEKMQSTLDGRR